LRLVGTEVYEKNQARWLTFMKCLKRPSRTDRG
jgi:hypothetical protein